MSVVITEAYLSQAHMGVLITNDNREDMKINNRFAAASRAYWSVEKMLKSKWLSRKTKIRIYYSILLPVLLYGSQTWVLTKESEKKLIVFENGVLRKKFGPVHVQDGWRIRNNRELRDIYTHPDIVAMAKTRILR